MSTHTGGESRPRKLTAKMARRLIPFMKSGNPNGDGIPPWRRYTSANGEALIFYDVCEDKTILTEKPAKRFRRRNAPRMNVAAACRERMFQLLPAQSAVFRPDPVAALAMIPIILHEGIQSLKRKKCCEDCCWLVPAGLHYPQIPVVPPGSEIWEL